MQPFATKSPIWKGRTTIKEDLFLDFIVRFSIKNDTVIGSIDIPQQNAKDIPLHDIRIENDTLFFTLKPPQQPETLWAKYSFAYVADASSLTGSLSQAGQTFSTTLTQSKKEEETTKRPQTPQAPFPYSSKEVTYTNPNDKATLAGTLTIPQGEGPHPVALLITGSGQQDRDETIFAHKPFWVVADHLSRNGIAVLRVDDRGVGGSTGLSPEVTSFTFAEDVSAGLDFLAQQPEIDRKKMGLMGHSEGGLIAPIVASQRSDVAFLVLLAGPGLNGLEILVQQNYDFSIASGIEKEKTDTMINHYRLAMQTNLSPEEEKTHAKNLISSQLAISQQEIPEDQLELVIQNFVDAKKSAWMQTFLTTEPAEYLKKVQAPVLALNGSLDLQVHAEKNLEAIRKALKEGGNSNFEVEKLDSLNHLFQQSETGLVEEYGAIEETIHPSVLERVLNWIQQQTTAK